MGEVEAVARVGRASYGDREAVEQVGAQLEERWEWPAPAAEVLLESDGSPDLAVSGTAIAGEFRCADCGYGAIVQRELPQCPMCGGTVWESLSPVAARGVR
jgi:rubrerythrin